MVVVALGNRSCVDLDQICRAVRSHFVEAAALVDYQPLAVRSPVRGFNQERELFDDLVGLGLKVIYFKIAYYFLRVLR